jgi:nitroimidazol reductase NimA-like FMN-containing flavoprotein (pyridoxamine 5'-phosphate oxidase superfamily)
MNDPAADAAMSKIPPRRSLLEDLGDAETERILAMKKSAIVAFVDARGFPRMLPCWFLWDGDAFYTTSDSGKFHVKALRQNDRASFCVEHERFVDGRYRGNRQVKGVGRVEIFPDQNGEWIRRILAKYIGGNAWPDRADGIGERVVLRLKPERMSAHGGDIDWPDDGMR